MERKSFRLRDRESEWIENQDFSFKVFVRAMIQEGMDLANKQSQKKEEHEDWEDIPKNHVELEDIKDQVSGPPHYIVKDT